MEFTSGYREAILEFSEVLFSWYKRYLLDSGGRPGQGTRNREKEDRVRSLPYDNVCWILHVLRNGTLGFRLKSPEGQIGGGFYGDDALRLRDLSKHISLIDLTEGGNEGRGEREADGLYRIDYLLMVAEETGSVMGVDFLLSGGGGGSGQSGQRALGGEGISPAVPMHGQTHGSRAAPQTQEGGSGRPPGCT
ncbi:zinc finger MYND domain-containing protein 15-like, partial [Ascaphus truei]|uniref:zinc finger MYND domain-containing protein 15-like n=1 Tax=Ascaphus truei TaxID=8439 RepID=UPI003F5AD9C5